MLRDNNLMHKFPEIVKAMGETVAKGGFGTSVTPVSQFYFQQAFNNVMFGSWKKIAEGYGKMVLGYFGKTPVAPDADVVKLASEQLGLEPTTKMVADINDADTSKGRKPAIKMLEEAGLPQTEENIFIAASCKEKGILFLTGKSKVNGVRRIDREAEKAKKSGEYTVSVNGTAYGVKVGKNDVKVNGVSYPLDVANGIDEAAIAASIATASTTAAAPVASGAGTSVKAPMPGLALRFNCKVGEVVEEGDSLMVMEAMKMENEIFAPCAGTITEICVNQGDQITADEDLIVIG